MRQQPEEVHDPVVLAIERVLEAERSSEAKLQDGRNQAKALVAAARERAAAITRRAEARISTLHTAYLQKIGSNIANLENSKVSASGTVAASDLHSALMKAADRLAAKLTGGT